MMADLSQLGVRQAETRCCAEVHFLAAARFFDTAGHTFAADIGALADAGITKGCDPPANDRFCPDAPVTRGQMAAFLRRALQDRTPGR